MSKIIRAKQVKNCKLIVPVDGQITIGGDGIVEVSDACAAQLLTIENDWESVEGKTKKPDEGTETDGEGVENFEDKVNAMTVAELKAMCEEAGLPEEEWKNLKKKDLVDYVVSKFNDAEETDEEEDDDEVED